MDPSSANSPLTAQYEAELRKSLITYLRHLDAIDEPMPECPDVEELWPQIASAYLPDGAREFQEYPVTSLGWMMLLGMAMAYYWDTDWQKYGSRTDLYEELRDKRGYDDLDITIVNDLLGYEGEKSDRIIDCAASCAARALSVLKHSKAEPGTAEAYEYYIATLHQLYLIGMAVELNALGYHMTPLNLN